jgi:hypothetical protein
MAIIGEATPTPAPSWPWVHYEYAEDARRRIEVPRLLRPPAIAGALLALLVLTISPAPQRAASTLPGAPAATLSALPLAAQSLVSRTLGRDGASYSIHRSGSLSARNTAHGLSARFGAEEVQVRSGEDTLSLRLRAAGYGRSLQPVAAAAPRAHGNRVSYRRGPLTEWYANGPLGLEQGFTLEARPSGARNGPLTLALSLGGTLQPALERGARSLSFGSSSVRYTGLAAFDVREKRLPVWLELRGQTLLIRVDDAHARYPLTIDPFIQQAKLTTSDGNAIGTVATAGDTIVAGAGNAVYVFVKPASGWANGTQAAKLTASDGAGLASVAISGDTIVAGAQDATVSGNVGQGAVYVFVKPASGWANGTQTARLTASDGSANDLLGGSVAIAADTIVAGAPFAPYTTTGDSEGPGAAYVFVKPAGGWVSGRETARLVSSDGPDTNWYSSKQRFGASVAISGGTIVVGAPLTFWPGTGIYFVGAVYVFVKPPGGWSSGTETAELTDPAASSYEYLGHSVAISGDTIAAGAHGVAVYHDGQSHDSQGAVYVFVKPSSGWADGTQPAILTASDGTTYDFLGFSVAMVGGTVVAGAPGVDVLGRGEQGAAYVFAPTAWGYGSETQKLTDPDGAPGDRFGVSVAWGNTIVVGPGSARVFVQAPAAIAVTKQLLPASDPGRFDLRIGGTLVKAGAGNGDSGSIGVAAGTYRVSESAAAGTSLSDYSTSIACMVNGNPGPAADGTTHLEVTVATGDNLACTITNRRKATVTLTKHLLPVSDAGRFDLKLSSGMSTLVRVVKTSAGDGDSGSIQVAPGTWTVLESAASGTNLSDYVSSIACTLNGKPGPSANGMSLPVQLAPAAVLACTFTNRQTATITLTKSLVPASDAGRFDLRLGQIVVKAGTGDGGSGSIQVLPGTYRVTESGVSGAVLSNYNTSIACTLNGGAGPSANGTTKLDVTVAAHDLLACTLTNRRKASITVVKHLVPSSDAGRFDLKVGATVVKAGAGDGGSGSRLVAAGTYRISEVAAAGTSLADYTSAIACTRNGNAGPSGTGASLNLTTASGDVLVCTITNQRR